MDGQLELAAMALAVLLASAGLGAAAGNQALESEAAVNNDAEVDLSPLSWKKDYETFLAAQGVERSSAGYAEGKRGAVTVAYNGLAARAGLEALEQGGNAIDAAMTTAMAQVVLTAGAPISFFGIQSLVYYDAESKEVYTMNAEWNTVLGETDPLTIPGGLDFSSDDALRGNGEPSGRTAMVGGFLKGVEAAHGRFGRLAFAQLFEPAIYIAENGMPVTEKMAGYFEFRGDHLKRLEETRKTFLRPDGSFYQEGDTFAQPALAATLRRIAAQGTDYVYGGPWGKKLIEAIDRDGGKMTLDDLRAYEVIWAEPIKARIGDYEIYTNPPPNLGGVALIEAQNLARAAGLDSAPHWTKSGESLRIASEICQMLFLNYLPAAMTKNFYPELDLSPEARVLPEHARALWQEMSSGKKPFRFAQPASPRHSDDVVVIDEDGNIAAITHSINAVLWGRTAIVVDGITIADAASFQQAAIAQVEPGSRLPAPTETGILFKDGAPVLGFASMGSGLHQRTFQGLFNMTAFGMNVRDAIDTADFYLPATDMSTGALTVMVPKGRFDEKVLDDMGLAYEEVDGESARFGGEGIWIAISRDPKTGLLRAASHNRNNSAAVAW